MRVRTAGEEERQRWRDVVVEFLRHMRAAQLQLDKDMQERITKRSLDLSKRGRRDD